MTNRGLFPTKYPQAFEDFWRAFGSVKNASKADGLRAWMRVEKVAPPAAELIKAAKAYQKWLDEENARRAKQRQADHPKCHPATWLRQKRWEGFLEEEKIVPPVIVERTEYEKPLWEKLARDLGDDVYRAWFIDAKLENKQLIFPSPFKARWAQEKFSGPIKRAFGDVTIRAA